MAQPPREVAITLGQVWGSDGPPCPRPVKPNVWPEFIRRFEKKWQPCLQKGCRVRPLACRECLDRRLAVAQAEERFLRALLDMEREEAYDLLPDFYGDAS